MIPARIKYAVGQAPWHLVEAVGCHNACASAATFTFAGAFALDQMHIDAFRIPEVFIVRIPAIAVCGGITAYWIARPCYVAALLIVPA